MKYCSKCGNEVMDEAVICPKCGCAIQGQVTGVQSSAADAPDTGMAVLGFFIPVVGLILYLLWKSQTPLKAKSAGKGALIGFIVQFFIYVIIGVAYGIAMANL